MHRMLKMWKKYAFSRYLFQTKLEHKNKFSSPSEGIVRKLLELLRKNWRFEKYLSFSDSLTLECGVGEGGDNIHEFSERWVGVIVIEVPSLSKSPFPKDTNTYRAAQANT